MNAIEMDALRPAADGAGQAAELFIKTRLRMRQLLLLVALDEHRSIHRAAEAVHVTQPSASRQILDLEETLGVKLFERLPRGMQPTVFGVTMIRHARVALSGMAHAHSDVMALRSGLVGQVAIGSIVAPVMGAVPRAIAALKRHSPTLRISVHVDASNVLMERLRAGTLDFIIGRLTDEAEGIVYEELAEERICVVVRDGHPLLARPQLQLADLADAPWILPPTGTVLRSRFDWMFRQDGQMPPRNVVETTAMPLILALMREMDGLHVMPLELAGHFAQQAMLQVLPLRLRCRMDAFGIIVREGTVLSPGAALLLGELRKQAGVA